MMSRSTRPYRLMVLVRVLSSAASTLAHQAGREGVLDPVALHRRGGPERDEQVGLAGAGVPDQTQRFAVADPVPGREGVHEGGVDVGVGVVVEVLEVLLPREVGDLDAAGGGATVAVVDLGEQEFGEEPGVGELVLGRGGDGLLDHGPDRRKAQASAGRVDRCLGGFLGHATPTTQHGRR